MKKITMRLGGQFPTKLVLTQVLRGPDPQKGMTAEDMKGRKRILSVLEKMDDGASAMYIEDADHENLVALYKDHRFVIYHDAFMDIGDDIVGAEDYELPVPAPRRLHQVGDKED